MAQRRLVIDIPRLICIGGCGAVADGLVSYVTVDAFGAPPMVNLKPPAGWVQLNAERPPENDPTPARRFVICASCYQKGAAYGDTRTTAAIEVV